MDKEAEAERLARTVFVGNIPIKTKRQALVKHFSAHGPVESVRIRSAASGNLKLAQRAAVITGAIDGSVRDAVNAYVVFREASSVPKAVATNGAVAFGRHLRVDAAFSKGDPQPSNHKRSVFLGNLAFDTNEEALWTMFSPCGQIENVRLVRDWQTQKGKGFGYVCFADKYSVEAALELHDTELGERRIRVSRCKSSASLSRSASGSASSDSASRWSSSRDVPGKKAAKKLTQQDFRAKPSPKAAQLKKGREKTKHRKEHNLKKKSKAPAKGSAGKKKK